MIVQLLSSFITTVHALHLFRFQLGQYFRVSKDNEFVLAQFDVVSTKGRQKDFVAGLDRAGFLQMRINIYKIKDTLSPGPTAITTASFKVS